MTDRRQDPDSTYDESTNPSNGWRVPDDAIVGTDDDADEDRTPRPQTYCDQGHPAHDPLVGCDPCKDEQAADPTGRLRPFAYPITNVVAAVRGW